MKLHLSFQNRRGSTLVVVLVLCCITLLILGSALQWSSTSTKLSQRNNEYFRTVAVAEGATEKLISRMMADYRNGGEPKVFQNTNTYRGFVPTSADNALLAKYEFGDGQGNKDKIFVQYKGPTLYTNLDGPYRDLHGVATPFRIISNAKQLDSIFQITGAVRQDFQLATIPLFQFAIFYNLDLEIAPGPDMVITGPVHGNEDIYIDPGATLTFKSDVLAAGDLIMGRKDGTTPSGGTTYWGPKHKGGASSLNLPIGTNNTPDAVRQVVEVPPSGESVASDMGKERFYNKADMIIRWTNGSFQVRSSKNNGLKPLNVNEWNGLLTPLTGFINTNKSFFNKRENKTIYPIEIDIGKLALWNALPGNGLKGGLTNSGGNVTIIYVADERTMNSSSEGGVRLVNGRTLLPKGLTVASPSPIYIWDNYNAPDLTVGSTNTSATLPAAIIGDSITILSGNWTDANSTSSLSSRVARDTTVNAAFLAGIVQTTTASYSGGVENFPRFLEDWKDDKTLTYNGSMVVMYPTKYAIGLWGGTGDYYDIYNPPIRKWAFDQNFASSDLSKLPPGTPMIRGLIRSTWRMIKPNTTIVAGP